MIEEYLSQHESKTLEFKENARSLSGVDAYLDAGFSWKQFVQELDKIGEHYKRYFDK